MSKESSVGHFDKGSKVTGKEILVFTGKTEDTTVIYLKCIRSIAIKATISFAMSACQFALSRETDRFPADRIL